MLWAFYILVPSPCQNLHFWLEIYSSMPSSGLSSESDSIAGEEGNKAKEEDKDNQH
jgi:hypothetical protein